MQTELNRFQRIFFHDFLSACRSVVHQSVANPRAATDWWTTQNPPLDFIRNPLFIFMQDLSNYYIQSLPLNYTQNQFFKHTQNLLLIFMQNLHLNYNQNPDINYKLKTSFGLHIFMLIHSCMYTSWEETCTWSTLNMEVYGKVEISNKQ